MTRCSTTPSSRGQQTQGARHQTAPRSTAPPSSSWTGSAPAVHKAHARGLRQRNRCTKSRAPLPSLAARTHIEHAQQAEQAVCAEHSPTTCSDAGQRGPRYRTSIKLRTSAPQVVAEALLAEQPEVQALDAVKPLERKKFYIRLGYPAEEQPTHAHLRHVADAHKIV